MPRLPIAMTIVALATAAAPAAPPAPGWAGVWRNASNSVHLRAAPCGRGRDAGMCGTVIWASPKAKADVAARGRTLVGAQLFRDFQPTGDGAWEGEVYVPDIDRSFSGTITLEGRNRLVGEGCLFGGFGCKQQVWTRVVK
ncbi:DUF2147 domain-containing protein [Sphingomonas donggukensis]|uniref:DUF2147 domain-containing protein n=1 Tax=Sphingomonas donggukensis TaxID=2949093 RepID=A0ABY4TRM9_9SPHN|nr:DUF2147 domain-containing protein [Sphingomonas donggukensis]URW74604.1 DUF2147 domain-containing protein [Sphingomonas donggukensis]